MEVDELLKDERLESGGGLFLLDRGVWEGKKVREVQEGGIALRAADRDSKASFEDLMRLQAEKYQEENRVAWEVQRMELIALMEENRMKDRLQATNRFDNFRSLVKKDAKRAKEEATSLREEVTSQKEEITSMREEIVLLKEETKEAVTARDAEIEEIKEKLVIWEDNSFVSI